MGVWMKTMAVGFLYLYLYARLTHASPLPEAYYEPRSLLLLQAALGNIFLAVLFRIRRCAWIIGKDPADGRIPMWSYLLWWGFHLSNAFFVYAAHYGRKLMHPSLHAASEVVPGFFVGGWFVDEARRTCPGGVDGPWAGVVDLTTELPERAAQLERSSCYLNLQVWDGNAPSIEQMNAAAAFIAEKFTKGKASPVVVHCAFGVGRSATVASACLVRIGAFPTADEAFAAVKRARPCARLNAAMSARLKEWKQQFTSKRR